MQHVDGTVYLLVCRLGFIVASRIFFVSLYLITFLTFLPYYFIRVGEFTHSFVLILLEIVVFVVMFADLLGIHLIIGVAAME